MLSGTQLLLCCACRYAEEARRMSTMVIKGRHQARHEAASRPVRTGRGSSRLAIRISIIVTSLFLVAGIFPPTVQGQVGMSHPVPPVRHALTRPLNSPPPVRRMPVPGTGNGGPTPEDLKQLSEMMKQLTPKERKQVTKAMKRLTPEGRRQVVQMLKHQLAAPGPTSHVIKRPR